jgi:hypothetical protein
MVPLLVADVIALACWVLSRAPIIATPAANSSATRSILNVAWEFVGNCETLPNSPDFPVR